MSIQIQDIMKPKTLREFLVILNRLNRANIAFLDGKDAQIVLGFKYDKEIKAIQELINSFDFVGGKCE